MSKEYIINNYDQARAERHRRALEEVEIIGLPQRELSGFISTITANTRHHWQQVKNGELVGCDCSDWKYRCLPAYQEAGEKVPCKHLAKIKEETGVKIDWKNSKVLEEQKI